MLFSDSELTKRLEQAEGHACVKYAEARRRLFPASGTEWIECAGAFAVFNGPDSPVTQSFGLGLFEGLNASALDKIEQFFFDRGAPADHEISPFAGVEALNLLCARNYRPIEISNVMYKPVQRPETEPPARTQVRVTGTDEAQLWGATLARGWAAEHPEYESFLLEAGAISAAREEGACFLAKLDGQPGAAGSLSLHNGVALFGGAATVPEMRRCGLQAALLHARMQYAFDHGYDVAMMVAEVGSGSQRNAERNGFQVAYTRTKWRLTREARLPR